MGNPLLDHAMRRETTHWLPVERHGTFAERNETGYDTHQRCLAGAIRSDHAHRFALRHLQGDPEQSLEGSVAGGN